MSNVINNLVVTAINEATLGLNIPSYLEAQVDAAIKQIADGISVQADEIAETLRARGIEAGLSESDVENVLIEVGLADAPVEDIEEVVVEDAEPGSLAALTATVNTIAATVEKIVAAATRQGLSI